MRGRQLGTGGYEKASPGLDLGGECWILDLEQVVRDLDEQVGSVAAGRDGWRAEEDARPGGGAFLMS